VFGGGDRFVGKDGVDNVGVVVVAFEQFNDEGVDGTTRRTGDVDKLFVEFGRDGQVLLGHGVKVWLYSDEVGFVPASRKKPYSLPVCASFSIRRISPNARCKNHSAVIFSRLT
jgi:hypothetical protein